MQGDSFLFFCELNKGPAAPLGAIWDVQCRAEADVKQHTAALASGRSAGRKTADRL